MAISPNRFRTVWHTKMLFSFGSRRQDTRTSSRHITHTRTHIIDQHTMGPKVENMTLRLESGVGGIGCYDESLCSPSSTGTAAVGPEVGSISRRFCEQLEKLPRSVCFRNIILGQVLSLLIAIMSMSAASLDDRGVNLPSFVNFVNYSTIMLVFFFPLLMSRRESLQLTLPWWRYALYALVRRETSITAVVENTYSGVLLNSNSSGMFVLVCAASPRHQDVRAEDMPYNAFIRWGKNYLGVSDTCLL